MVEEHHNRQRQQSNHQRGQKRNGTPSSDPSLIRRHTTPDMAASAAYGMVLCGTDELEHRYRGRIEKVKFGVPVNEAFSPDIPATLLVLLLKVNKEGPLKKDIWRAPGNQAQVRKLSNIMQHGRLVNISNISVYTAASVIKRFLAKLPGGILGADNEKRLFESMQQEDFGDDSKRELFCRIVSNLPIPSQHLLVLLFGTFRVITDSAETFGTRMTPEAIGISVAPSLFHTCIHDGQRAKLEDVLRFKIASQVISEIIRGFGYTNLFPRECYEFYARITGRTLRVDEQWHFSFQLPSNGIGCFNPIAVNRRNSRRSRRKSSSSASSVASILSQLHSTQATAFTCAAPVQINDNFDGNAKTPENYLPTPLGAASLYSPSAPDSICQSVSQQAKASIVGYVTPQLAATSLVTPIHSKSPPLVPTMRTKDIYDGGSKVDDLTEQRRRSSTFFLHSPSMNNMESRTKVIGPAPTNNDNNKITSPLFTGISFALPSSKITTTSNRLSNSGGGNINTFDDNLLNNNNTSWYTQQSQQNQADHRRKAASAAYAGPPPPPTSALQRRIDAYCAAANINPKEKWLQAQPQMKKQNHKRRSQSQQQLHNRSKDGGLIEPD